WLYSWFLRLLFLELGQALFLQVLQQGLDGQRDQGERRQQRGDGKRGRHLAEALEQLLDPQRDRVGGADDAAGEDVDRPELAGGAGGAEAEAVEHDVLDVRQRPAAEHLPCVGPTCRSTT